MLARDFGRLLTAMVTPFKEDLSVDFEAISELARYLVAHGSEGLVVSGTTGESPTLSHQEKLDLVKGTKDAVGPDVAVIAGTCSNNTQDSVELTAKAQDAGADGILMVTPYYNKPPQEALVEHFCAIAHSTPLPCIVYNVPGRTACNVLPETVLRCAERESNIRGAKEASGQLSQITEVIRLVRDLPAFVVWSGNDADTLPVMATGGYGIISVASHLVGDEMSRMIKAFLAGDLQQAADLNLALAPLVQALFIKGSVNPAPVKYAVHKLLHRPVYYRLPMVPPNAGIQAVLDTVMRELGLLE